VNIGCGGHHHPETDYCRKLSVMMICLFADGEMGEVVITTLGVEGMPLLRFRNRAIWHVNIPKQCKVWKKIHFVSVR
jgi:hypothetical protein